MAAANGEVQIIFNGEIYNFPELKKELENKGHTFKTNSDTEVILRAYLQWDEACVEKLNGMFVFGIWDVRSRKIFLARDRVGKKPLYYHWDGKTFSFASELKALLAGNLVPPADRSGGTGLLLDLRLYPGPENNLQGSKKTACGSLS